MYKTSDEVLAWMKPLPRKRLLKVFFFLKTKLIEQYYCFICLEKLEETSFNLQDYLKHPTVKNKSICVLNGGAWWLKEDNNITQIANFYIYPFWYYKKIPAPNEVSKFYVPCKQFKDTHLCFNHCKKVYRKK